VILNAETINFIDSSALSMLEKIFEDHKNQGLKIMIAGATGPVRDIIFGHDLIQIIGEENLFIKTSEAVNAFLEGTTTSAIQKKITLQSQIKTNLTQINPNKK
jgi:SulP family sulfate permease